MDYVQPATIYWHGIDQKLKERSDATMNKLKTLAIKFIKQYLEGKVIMNNLNLSVIAIDSNNKAELLLQTADVKVHPLGHKELIIDANSVDFITTPNGTYQFMDGELVKLPDPSFE